MSPEARQRKIAYLRQWYAKNRESEIQKAMARKKKMLSQLTPAALEIYKLRQARYGKTERLRRDLKRSLDPKYDAIWKQKKRLDSARKLERIMADPVKREARRLRHNARVQDYKRRKKTGDLRKSQELFRLGGTPIKEKKPKAERLPSTPKAIKKLRMLSITQALQSLSNPI